MFLVGAIPRGIPLLICMETWGAICARIGPGALGRARLNVKNQKCHKCTLKMSCNIVCCETRYVTITVRGDHVN